jgi:hypothetical protein
MGITADGKIDMDPWRAADWFYEAALHKPTCRVAIDLDGSAIIRGAMALDLNEPVSHRDPDCFDIIINSGTLEHIFNQHQAWKTIHEACKVGGIMVHALPLWGWLDHGFYNYHPTFVADIAKMNDYKILIWLLFEPETGFITRMVSPAGFKLFQHRASLYSALMYVAFQKTDQALFACPIQNIYSGSVTAQEQANWRANR